MAEPHWTSYVSIVASVIATFIAIASYRKSSSIKALDLRIELRKSEHEYASDLKTTEELLDYANKSRMAVASAKGKLRSGMMEQWDQELASDKETLSFLLSLAPQENPCYDSLDQKELESKLVNLNKHQIKLRVLREKYKAAVQSDDEDRKFLREAAYRKTS